MDTQDFITAYLGLGANLGDRRGNIAAALRGLHRPPPLEVVRHSSLYETEPVGVVDQPAFLNAVAEVRTTLAPLELLQVILVMEKELGRVRNRRWGPRVIDIDILLYGGLEITLPALTVPHPRLAERAFALAPLAEVAPGACFPDGETAQRKYETLWEMAAKSGNNLGIRRV